MEVGWDMGVGGEWWGRKGGRERGYSVWVRGSLKLSSMHAQNIRSGHLCTGTRRRGGREAGYG